MKTREEIIRLVTEALEEPYKNTYQYNVEVLNDILEFVEKMTVTPKTKEEAIEELKANSYPWNVDVNDDRVALLSKENGNPIAILRKGFLMTSVPISVGSDYLTLINNVLIAQKKKQNEMG